jgi:retinol-binding protein 3
MGRKLLLALLAIGFQLYGFSQDTLTIDSKTKEKVINKVASIMQEKYVFAEIGEKMANFIHSQYKNGEYNSFTEVKPFCKKLTTDLRTICNDKHVFVFYSPEEAYDVRAANNMLPQEQIDKLKEKFIISDKRRNYGFQKLEILEGNIGYLKLTYCPNISAAETCIAAMGFLANTDAIIIDLRDNGGGEGIGGVFESYFFTPDRVYLGESFFRDTTLNTESWTLPYVPGKRMSDTDLYILTNSRTFSAAEGFTYGLQQIKRAVVVGETTKGGAHPIDVLIVEGAILTQVSIGYSYHKTSKTNWEGVGIKPDIEATSENALHVAHISALKHLIEKTTDIGYKKELESLLKTL